MTNPAVRHPGELRWETRLLTVVTATLVAFGLASSYGASSLVATSTGVVGASMALRSWPAPSSEGSCCCWCLAWTIAGCGPWPGRSSPRLS